MPPRPLSLATLGAAVDAALTAAVRAVGAIDTELGVWRHRQRTRRALRDLSPEILRDIGLTPHAAEREAEKPFWRG